MAQSRIWSIRTSYGYSFKNYMHCGVPGSITVSPGAPPAAALSCTRVKPRGRDRGDQGNATAAHFSFCRSLLEHTVSAENLSYRLQRNPGSSLTWHDGRSQRPDGGRTVKLLRQPGTEGSQACLISQC
ncbi:sterile alpha motif domain-containing protein 10 [Limosa lapponica baueri]|uniref:Sterile alpha motif domain-containing protein 10 n=1 Tax=Limosa lapponica baueri TaxID=1758121 RepID=A0A2I0T4V8_LIMLA|nr:sterile alpha motif domain-containing protein 10 [Limosa lapponica baueri]